MTRRVGIVAMAFVALALGGCSGWMAGLEPPVPCAARFGADRCEALAEAGATLTDRDSSQVTALEILPDPGSGSTYLGAPPVYLRLHLADGTSVDTMVSCGGISSSYVPACMDDPAIRVSSATMGGYRDVPCMDAGACPPVVPAIDPDAAAAAEPIRVDRLEIPISRVGRWEVPIGRGSLPNGILKDAAFQLVDDWPDDLRIRDAVVSLDVRSLEPDGKPFDNYYLHGWREGVERIEAVLVFEVVRFEPEAKLSIADVIVR